MLAMRLSRTGRRGHAMFRLVVQDARLTPTSGKVVAYVGHYDPHAKSVVLDKEKIDYYLTKGAQPSPRLARMLKKEGVKLPAWVKFGSELKRPVRNPDKRRSTRPAEAEAKAPAEPEPTEVQEAEAAEEEAAPKPETTTEPKAETTEEASSEADQPAAEDDKKAASEQTVEATEDKPEEPPAQKKDSQEKSDSEGAG